jgi:hypothetical protein
VIAELDDVFDTLVIGLFGITELIEADDPFETWFTIEDG